jgi:uncharacterized protein (TIGR00255 family)
MTARSMTGYARARTETSAGSLSLSIRAVNHRALDLSFHVPGDFDRFEPALRKAIQAKIQRGHLDIRITLDRAAAATGVAWNRPLIEAWLKNFQETARELGLDSKPDLNEALRLPGMLSGDSNSDFDETFEAALYALAKQALDELNAFRIREGADLAGVLLARLDVIRDSAARIEAGRAELAAALSTRLQQRLSELLGETVLDPARLAQEVALLADRSEIAEEIARLQIHIGALDQLLRGGGEIGKKIDFLLQEMNRETNTILSKSTLGGEAGRRIADLALGVKSEIEKIREQSLNLE